MRKREFDKLHKQALIENMVYDNIKYEIEYNRTHTDTWIGYPGYVGAALNIKPFIYS